MSNQEEAEPAQEVQLDAAARAGERPPQLDEAPKTSIIQVGEGGKQWSHTAESQIFPYISVKHLDSEQVWSFKYTMNYDFNQK